MNIYQLKLRSHYIEKSFEDKNLRNTLFEAMKPRADIFLIDEYFNPISITNKGSSFIKVHIYKIDKTDYESKKYMKSRNAHNMTIIYEKTDAQKSIFYPKHITKTSEIINVNFLNSYLDSNVNSRNIKKIIDKMSFLEYAIEYK